MISERGQLFGQILEHGVLSKARNIFKEDHPGAENGDERNSREHEILPGISREAMSIACTEGLAGCTNCQQIETVWGQGLENAGVDLLQIVFEEPNFWVVGSIGRAGRGVNIDGPNHIKSGAFQPK